jgi:hypothetical protein
VPAKREGSFAAKLSMIAGQETVQIGVIDVTLAQVVGRRPPERLVSGFIDVSVQKLAFFPGEWHVQLLRCAAASAASISASVQSLLYGLPSLVCK